jgi:hypothetical protein
MYYIYHIKGKKIGVSVEPIRRTKEQGFTEYEILEEFNCIYLVSYRERALQKQYGYKVDPCLYYETINAHTRESRSKGGTISGNGNVESGHLASLRTTEHQKKAGSSGGKIAKESGQWLEAVTKGWETNSKIVKCPYCDKEGTKLIMSRWHFDNCKHKP